MHNRMNRITEILTLVALAILTTCAASWAGPPAPPVISAPATPVGGPEVAILTAAGVAAYGYWKSRK